MDRIPRTVWALGVVSLFMDLSSEIIHALLPLFLTTTLGVVAAFVGIALWGLHMALTQGLMAKLVADRAPPELRGSAFGMFNLAAGVAMLFASVVAGLLWDRLGANSTFLAGAGFATIALIGLALNRVGSETVST